ncbi:hypothetical protein [Escherichia coli]|nr:hypothetical protein [Escherichia coli]
MSVKITGLDKMQKQLKEVERATEALNGSYEALLQIVGGDKLIIPFC